MTTDDDNAPLTDLDARLDDLVRAIARTPDLDGLIVGLRTYQATLALVALDDLDNPGTVDAIAVASVWDALADAAEEVRKLRKIKEADDGRS